MTNIVWKPHSIESTKMWQFMRFIEDEYTVSLKDYVQLHTWSINYPELFWPSLCRFFSINFSTAPETILKNSSSMINAVWFPEARLNYAEQLLKRRDNHPALVSIKENQEKEILSYQQLYEAVANCAHALKNAGITVGDRVAAVMPNVSMTIIAMLASASIGAIWSSCSPDFGAQAIIDRLGQIEPKVLFVCDGHQYMGKQHDFSPKINEISRAITSLTHLIICPNSHNKLTFEKSSLITTVTWNEFIQNASDCSFEPLPFNHPLAILFSSGTTGKPKCIVHGAGGTLLQHVKELSLHTNIHNYDNLFFYTTCGWMMWNWMVSTLALGATLTLYDGSPAYPDAYRLFKLIDEEKITVFGTSAKFISSIEKAGASPNEHYQMASLHTILSTGSPLLPKNYDFVYQSIKKEVQLSSISGGTDIVSCFALGNPLLPVRRGELQCKGLGMAVDVYNAEGKSVTKERGELVCTRPFPSMPIYFWKDTDKAAYKKAYFNRFPGIWAHGDYAEITDHQGVIIYGRSDTVLNPGGVRIGTAEIYRHVEKLNEIAESIVISQDWQEDVRIVLFVKLQPNVMLDKTLEDKIRLTIRQNASPRHVPAKILQVHDIPRTINGKIVELAVRQVVHGQPVVNIDSLANPESLENYKERKELSEN